MSSNAQRHFVRSRTLSDLITALRQLGIDLHDMVEDLVRGANAGALIVGSIAEGTGSDASDLDILLLFEPSASASGTDMQVQHHVLPRTSYSAVTTVSRDELIQLDGIEVNVERLEWNVFASAPGISRWIGLSPDREGAQRSVVLLDAELKLLHRIASGWPLSGDAIVQAWRNRLKLDMLPTYLAVSRYLFAMESLEDAAAAAEEHPAMAVYIGRGVVENLMTCRTGLSGGTSPSRRTFLRHIGSSPKDATTALKLLFPELPFNGDEAKSYLRQVYALTHRIRSEFDHQSVMAMAIKMAETKLHHRLPRWLIQKPED